MTVTVPDEVPRPALADGIRRAAAATGLPRGELARRCGLSPATLTAWIAGYGNPTEKRLVRFARQTGVTVEDLRQGLPGLYSSDD